MKRHPALQDLSRDHHHALVRARRARRAGDGDTPAADARDALVEWWRDECLEHFGEEEEILLPALPDSARGAEPIARMRDDHAWLRSHADDLARRPADDPDLPALLREFGERLRDHVRLEEREVFPLVERTLDEDALEALHDALVRRRRRVGRGVGPRS